MDDHLKDRLEHLTPSEKQKMLHDHEAEIYGATGVDPKKELSTAYGETGFEGTPDSPTKVNPNRKQRREAIKKQKKLDEKRRLEFYKRARRHQSRRRS